MKNRLIYTMFAFVLLSNVNAQTKNSKTEKADKQYDNYAYVDAIKTYERLYSKGYKSSDMFQKLGNAYYFKSDYESASKWYGELFTLTQDVEPEYYYRYSQSLKGIKDYKKADEMMAVFYNRNGNDNRAKLAKSQKDYLSVIKKNSGRYTIENANINSSTSDYGSSFYNNKVVFASSRDTSATSSKRHEWNGETFSELYAADMGEDGALFSPVKFGGKINTKFHESTPVFTKDGKTVYFTRNNFLEKKAKDKEDTILLKIYKATLEGDQWTNVVELPFNSNEYSVAHPALSPDEKTLYFASNMPGTLGLSDIFKVEIQGDNSFGTPINLGNRINTEAKETFPFVTPENELYFASDGHPGLGGLDVFMSKLEKDGSYSPATNVGEPLNSSKDDFGFLINTVSKTGYVSSNRSGGNGNDDIYRFKETKAILARCDQKLSGVVTDSGTNLPLEKAKVTLLDYENNAIKEVSTDKEGKYDLGEVECGTQYLVRIEKFKYTTTEKTSLIPEGSGETQLPITLTKSTPGLNVGTNLAGRDFFDIKQIYFDLDKSYIRKDAEIELAKILDVLEQYPTMELDIRSHTDSRNTAKYNQSLSDRRAKSTRDWLVSKGINGSRLTAKGYGESLLVNYCSDGFDCSEEEHQANRRSEFIITKM